MWPVSKRFAEAVQEPSRGGYISGHGAGMFRVRELGTSPDGYRMVSVNDGPPEYVLSPEQVRALGSDALDRLNKPQP